MSAPLARMIGFRNVAVRQYRELEQAIVEAVLRRDLDHLLGFGTTIARL